MNFTDTEIQYLTHEAQTSGHKVVREFEGSVHNYIASFHETYGYVSEEKLFASQLADCAASVVDAHVNQYLTLSKELDKYPDGEDLKILADFTKPFVRNLLPRYRGFAERPFGDDTPKEIIDAAEQTLEVDLETIFVEGWAPMITLHMKGRVAEERSNLLTPRLIDQEPLTTVHQTYNNFHGPVGAFQQGNNSTAAVEVSDMSETSDCETN